MAGNGRVYKRNQERIAVTLQLVVGVDDDLIQAIEPVEKKHRNAALKSALRRALDLPQPEPQADRLADLEARLTRQSEVISWQNQQLQELYEAIQAGAQNAPANGQLEALYQQVETISRQLNNFTGIPTFDQTPVESVQQVDNEKLEERRANRKKNQW